MNAPVSTPRVQNVATYGAVVGQILARLRTEQGRSQAEIAQHLGVAQSLISRVETGALPLTIATLGRWSAFLGTKPAAVLVQAEESIEGLQRQGVTVLFDAPPAIVRPAPANGDTAKALLGAAAVGALIALILGSKE